MRPRAFCRTRLGVLVQDAQAQSDPHLSLLQRQVAPQRQLGLQAQPSALDVLNRTSGASLILVSMYEALIGVREDTLYLRSRRPQRLNETATTF